MPYATGGGDLRSRVKFSMLSSVSDEYGNTTTTWIDKFTVAAQINPRLGGETVEAARLTGRQPVVIRVRNSADTRAIRVDWKATDVRSAVEYNVRSIADPLMGESQHRQWIDVLAESGVAV